MKFYETNNTKVKIIENLIFDYANLEMQKNKIIIKCDHCNLQYTLFKIKKINLYFLEYQIIASYPDRGDFITSKIVHKTLCSDCSYIQHMYHKVLNKSLINNIN